MKFDWRNFTKCEFDDMIHNPIADWYYGAVHVGEICFDIVVRFYDEDIPTVTLDCYVGNENTGYGYRNGIHYDYADGFDIKSLPVSYNEFVKTAEIMMEKYIKTVDKQYDGRLTNKANKPVLIW